MRWVLGLRQRRVGLVFLVLALAAPGVPASADALECGDVLTEDTVFQADLVCEGVTALVIGADGITVDLDGHRLTGSADAIGISNAGHDSVTISNGRIERFGTGIRFWNVSDSLIEDMTLERQADTAIHLRQSSSNVIRDNAVSDLAQTGIRLEVSSDHNTVVSNSVRDVGWGVHVTLSSTENLVTRNHVREFDRGILVSSDRNEITKNVVEVGGLDGIGIVNADFNLVRANTVAGSYYGIMLATDTDSNEVIENRITESDVGIFLFGQEGRPPNQRNSIDRNQIIGSRRAGIIVSSHTRDAQVTSNTLTSNHLGILIGGPSVGADQTIVSKNTVVDSRTNGVQLEANATGTVLDRNSSSGNGSTPAAHDGFDIDAPGTTVTKNKAFFNTGYGISATSGVIDGGGNKARHNDAGQCVNVVCK
jgi:parallel beta-helix repeat protein